MSSERFEEYAVSHQVSVAELLGVFALPCLDPIRNQAEERVSGIPWAWVELGRGDVRVLEPNVLADRHLLEAFVDEDDVSRRPNRGSSSAGMEKVAARSARARGRDDDRLT